MTAAAAASVFVSGGGGGRHLPTLRHQRARQRLHLPADWLLVAGEFGERFEASKARVFAPEGIGRRR